MMTSRERFHRTLNHQEPDRVPIDAGQDLHNGLHEVAYRNLLRKLGETDGIHLYDQMQHLAVVKESVLDRLHVDTRYVFAGAGEGFQIRFDPDRSWLDEWGVRRKPCGLYDECVGHPLENVTLAKVKALRFPNPRDPARFSGIRERALKLRDTTDFAVVAGTPATLFYLASELVGFQEFMEKLITEPQVLELLVDRLLEYWIDFFDGYMGAIGDLVELVWMGDDWGAQSGPVIDPALFRQLFAGRYRQLTDSIKKKARVKIALHSCGAVQWAMDDFADAGIDVLHPLQGDAAGMEDPVLLKENFGKRLVFYSNIRNQSTLPHGSPAEVRADVTRKMKHLAPGGGYIVSGGHNIQADVPPENILALYDTAFELGHYPIKL